MDHLRVRVYNVRFGDAILIALPDSDGPGGTETRHILIDVGNVPSHEGGDESVFAPVLQDVLAVLNGRPLDLYVMTHEHMDHVRGLLYASKKLYKRDELRKRLQVQHAWLTSSAAPDYYQHHPEAKKKLDEARELYDAIGDYLRLVEDGDNPLIRTLMALNNPGITADCVDYLRTLAQHTWYIHRGVKLTGKHPFREAGFDIWAPEEDTSVYYGRFHPLALGVASATSSGGRPALIQPMPPAGVDAGAFYDLVDSRERSYLDTLLAIDKAANNTSIVFSLQWRGWRLVFAGDAEGRSWQIMAKNKVLSQAHWLKVSHHGSYTGTPGPDILNQVLPATGGTRYSAVSTFDDTYNNVPDPHTLKELAKRSKVSDTRCASDGQCIEFSFAPGGKKAIVTPRGK